MAAASRSLAGPLSKLTRSLRLCRWPADQLDQPQNDQQQDDDQDDDCCRGLTPEYEYQGGECHRADTEDSAVRVSPLAGRAGRHPPTLAEVPDPVQSRFARGTGPDRRGGGPGEERCGGDDQPEHQQGTERILDEANERVEQGGGGIAWQHAAGDAVEVDATEDLQVDAKEQHGEGEAEP